MAQRGKRVRKADLLITVETSEETLKTASIFLEQRHENANYMGADV